MNDATRRLGLFAALLSLVALLLPPAFAEGSAIDGRTLLERSAGGPKRGVLYEIAGSSGTINLFGTIHLGKAAYYPLDSGVMGAFVAAPCLAVEADVTDASAVSSAMATFAAYPEGDRLDLHVPPALAARSAALAERFHLPPDQVQRMKPWMLATTLAAADAMQDGYQPAFGADLVLLALAGALGKPIVEIESLRGQLALFDSLSPAEQAGMLEDAVGQIERGEGRRTATALLEAWAGAEAGGMESALAREEERWPAALRPAYSRLVTGRNAPMADRIEQLLREGRTCFVAIGAAHLLGPDSVPSILQRRGYRVRRH